MWPNLQITLIQLFYGLFAFAAVSALIWGGMPKPGQYEKRSILRRLFPLDPGFGPERLAILIVIYMFFVQIASTFIFFPRYDQVDPGSLLVDVVGVIGFFALVRTSTSWWTVWPTAFQCLALLSHFPRQPLPIELFGEFAYGIMKSGLTLGAVIAVIIGIALHQRRLAKNGFYLFWRDQTLWHEFKYPMARQLRQDPASAIREVPV